MKNKRKGMTLSQRNAMWGYIFLGPWMFGLLFVFLVPMCLSVAFSFSKVIVNKGFHLSFIGFANFQTALTQDEKFVQLLASALLGIVYDVPVILVFSFFVAVLLKENFKGVNAFKFIFFLPVIMSSELFLKLQTNFGQTATTSLDAILNSAATSLQVLKSMNLTVYLQEMKIPENVITVLTGPVDKIYEIISRSGIQIFIFLAAINAVPASLYEAAHVEGANSWEKFWKITFPMVTPMILVNIVYSVIDTFTSVNNGVMQYVYQLSFQKFNFGLASAMTWFYFAALAVILLVVFRLFSHRTFYYT